MELGRDANNWFSLFIPKYFLVFDAVINGIVFFISFSSRPVVCTNWTAESQLQVTG